MVNPLCNLLSHDLVGPNGFVKRFVHGLNLHARLFQFTVIADSKTEADFLYSLRTDTDSFITITDRFGTDRTAFVLPGFPVEIETMDEPLHEPVRAYQIMAQEVT